MVYVRIKTKVVTGEDGKGAIFYATDYNILRGLYTQYLQEHKLVLDDKELSDELELLDNLRVMVIGNTLLASTGVPESEKSLLSKVLRSE